MLKRMRLTYDKRQAVDMMAESGLHVTLRGNPVLECMPGLRRHNVQDQCAQD